MDENKVDPQSQMRDSVPTTPESSEQTRLVSAVGEQKAATDEICTANGSSRDEPVDASDQGESSMNAVLQRMLSREFVEVLMREQDAELLESIHNSEPNASGMTPVVMSKTPSLSMLLGDMPELSLKEDGQAAVSPMAGKRRASRALLREHLSNASTTDGLNDQGEPGTHTRRVTLSGDIWINQEHEVDVLKQKDDDDRASLARKGEQDLGDDQRQEEGSCMRRTESMDRRLNEAAQFAEAVGDLPVAEQDELRIIETEADDDDDDDDDDATEIRVDETIIISSQSHAIGRPKAEELRKSRPQWPFGTGGSQRIFLDKLPDQGTGTQDFVYKGIQSNPPEIVKRGTTRGNYAQLHRKAWLEVSDKYHRYGKNLRLYYRYWESSGCPTGVFFDWLDSKGEAAGQPLPELKEECPRAKLDSDTVLYITNPDVTGGYAVRFIPDNTGLGLVVDVDGDPVRTGPEGWIFVLRDNVMYGAPKITTISGHSKKRFHHSSFFGGKAVVAAGIFITDDDGLLTRLYPHSGHYRPGEAHMQRVLFYLHHEGVDLRTFEMDMQQILHVSRDKKQVQNDNDGDGAEQGVEKKKKVESLHLVPAVLAACFLAHKARFIGNGIFSQIHRIRTADVTSVTEALDVIDS